MYHIRNNDYKALKTYTLGPCKKLGSRK